MTRNRSKMKKNAGGTLPSNDVLEYDILPRLPVDSLLRFKLVCKRWNFLISEDPIFGERQSQVYKPSSGLLYWAGKNLLLVPADGRSMSVPDPCLKFLSSYVSVSNSCNGLICGIYVRDELWPEIYVCNPVTQKFRSIPNPEKRHILGLAFNPSIPNAHFDLICPYRIPNSDPTEYGFDVFTSSRGVWTESKKRVTISSKCVTGRSYFAGGLLYFRAENDAVWFDPNKDLSGVIKLPISNEPKSSALCVALLHTSNKALCKDLDVE